MEFDEDRFFSGASRGDYLDALTAHAGLGSVVVVDGDTGSGVSTLLGQAVMALLDDLDVVRIDGSDEHDANVVVEALLRHFDIERADLPETLRRTLAEGRLLVVVDNAEQLAAEALATMASLKQKLGARLGYCFGGQSGLVDQIRESGFAIDDVLTLPALTAEDIQDFAWFVLGQELDDAESEAQLEATEGNLAALLTALAADSDAGAGHFAARDDDDEPAFAAGTGVENDEPEAVDDQEEGADRAAPPWRHIAAVAGLLVVVILLWAGLSSGPDDEEGRRTIALPQPEGQAKPSGEAEQKPDTVEPMAPTMEPVARLEDLDNPESQTQVREEGGVVLEPVSDPVMHSDPPPEDKVMTLADNTESATATADEDGAEEQQGSVPEAAVAQPPSLTDADGYRHAGWLATVETGRWFLQITATSQKEGAQRVLDQLDRQGAYYEAERNGKPVWLVLAGEYSTRQAALDAKSGLPAKLREAGPFPRKIDDIRGEL